MKLIPLTKGQFAIVDDEDFQKVSAFKWQAVKGKYHKSFYAQRFFGIKKTGRQNISMHVFLMQHVDGMEIDHRDGNGLNNQRCNLRFATHAQNCANRRKKSNNTSGFKGVSFHRQSKKWRAVVRVLGKDISLGLHKTPELAHAAYCAGADRHHGEFAKAS